MVIFLIIYSKMLFLQWLYKDLQILSMEITSYFRLKNKYFQIQGHKKEREVVGGSNGGSCLLPSPLPCVP